VKTVFFDVDTQLDFLFPAGALYVPGAEDIVNTLGELTRFAAANEIQIISTADAHIENDVEFQLWKPHCVAGTAGQQKAANTLLSHSVVLGNVPGDLDAMRPRIRESSQIVLEKRAVDIFTNPNVGPLLELVNADRYVVYGVVTEICVQCAAFGLLERGARVELVSDASKALSIGEGQNVLARFEARGGIVTTAASAMKPPQL